MKYVIFDFDGTVADTFPHILAIGEQILGIEVDRSELETLRNTPTKKLIKQFKVPIYKLPGMVVQGRRMFRDIIHEVKPVKGMPELVKKLYDDGYRLLIISSNTAQNIHLFLRQNNLDQYCSKVYGNVGLFSKVQAIKKVLKLQHIAKSDCIYIGDEVRDIEAAHKVGIQVISVTSGLNGEKILRATKPDVLAQNAKEVLKAVEKILPL